MQLNLHPKTLKAPLAHFTKLVERNPVVPITKNLLLSAKRGKVSISATDLQTRLTVSLPDVEVLQNGACLIPFAQLQKFVKGKKDTLHLKTEDGKVTVRTENLKRSFTAENLAEYPTGPDDAQKNESLPAEGLHHALVCANSCKSTERSRYSINGLLLDFEGGAFRVVATDGYRLACFERNTRKKKSKYQVVIPQKAALLFEYLTGFHAEGDTFSIGIRKEKINGSPSETCTIRVGDSTLTFSPMQDSFASFKRVLPKPEQIVAHTVLPAPAFLKALSNALDVVGRDSFGGQACFTLQKNILTILGQSEENGEIETELHAPYYGAKREWGMKAAYLLDFIRLAKWDAVRLQLMENDTDQFLFTPQNNDGPYSEKYVVMPMRT